MQQVFAARRYNPLAGCQNCRILGFTAYEKKDSRPILGSGMRGRALGTESDDIDARECVWKTLWPQTHDYRSL
jgi:hypothetical protein